MDDKILVRSGNNESYFSEMCSGRSGGIKTGSMWLSFNEIATGIFNPQCNRISRSADTYKSEVVK